ncbi:MAG: hypothetical protein M0R06_01465 [Sphaerochaeta sp.]|nr:hypothetical protein [Sphaerochaeta sp.]
MDPATIVMLVTALLQVSAKLIETGQQIHGKSAIPTLDEILADNIALQARIDAEKGVMTITIPVVSPA